MTGIGLYEKMTFELKLDKDEGAKHGDICRKFQLCLECSKMARKHMRLAQSERGGKLWKVRSERK